MNPECRELYGCNKDEDCSQCHEMDEIDIIHAEAEGEKDEISEESYIEPYDPRDYLCTWFDKDFFLNGEMMNVIWIARNLKVLARPYWSSDSWQEIGETNSSDEIGGLVDSYIIANLK